MNPNDIQPILEQLETYFNGVPNEARIEGLNAVREFIHRRISQNPNPVDFVRLIPIDKVQANDYNPNAVATQELKLLYTSIDHDGYTQPIVCIYDEKIDKYIIVDGFHRYSVMRKNEDILKRNNGLLPCVVIEKNINDRMASTIRHNRARGSHNVGGMSDIVFKMLENGWTDAEICNEIGLEPDELIRLKHITGFSKLFANREYSKAWYTTSQLRLKQKYKEEHPEENIT